MGALDRDLENRTLRASVREIAEFALYPYSSKNSRALQWRAEIGTQWHETLRARTSKGSNGEVDFEQSVEGILSVINWEFHIRGRIDQVIHKADAIVLREIKTVNFPLPQSEENLREKYPEYFRQVILYHRLFRKKVPRNRPIKTCLLFVDINSGITQTILTTATDEENLDFHLGLMVQTFEDQKYRLSKLRSLNLSTPFDSWRDGQEEVRNRLQTKIETHPILFFQAPTGFGKTGLILEATLKRIQEGHASRIFFLTGKTTGQLPIRNQLDRIGGPQSGLRHFVIRNQKDLGSENQRLNPLANDNLGGIETRWKESGIEINDLFKNGTLSLEEIIELSEVLSIPAKNLNSFLLPHTEIWIGDYNYLFDPVVRKNFIDPLPYDPKETILIIDEAHNLPSRVGSSWSWSIDAHSVESVLTEIHFAKFADALTRSLDQLLSWLKRLSPSDELNPNDEADLFEFLKNIDQGWKASYLTTEEISPATQEWMWELSQRIDTWSCGLPFHTYAPSRGVIRRECLDASAWIAPIISEHQQTILMSATLHPVDSFAQSIGIQSHPSQGQLIALAPWQEDSFEVVIDKRVDTRYAQRERSYSTTARTLLHINEVTAEPFVVFFSSYRYAETIENYLKVQHPYLRIQTQPRTASLEEQEAFLEDSLTYSDIIFLIMGSRFSEGIDALGGRVKLAVIVGPALPEVNPVQKAKMATSQGPYGSGFRNVYQIPAMRKINQALGRLVRAPEHKATILLHCVRFSESSFIELLNPQCQPTQVIHNEADFQSWLHSRSGD